MRSLHSIATITLKEESCFLDNNSMYPKTIKLLSLLTTIITIVYSNIKLHIFTYISSKNDIRSEIEQADNHQPEVLT